MIATSLALSAVVSTVFGLTRTISPGMLGLSLTYCFTVVNNLNDLIGSLSETEQEMVSVERIAEYIDIPSEHKGDEDMEDFKIKLQINKSKNNHTDLIDQNNKKRKKVIIKRNLNTPGFFSVESIKNRIFGRAPKSKTVKKKSDYSVLKKSNYLDLDGLNKPLIDLEENVYNSCHDDDDIDDDFDKERRMKEEMKGGDIILRNVFLFYNQKSPTTLPALTNLSIKIPMVRSCKCIGEYVYIHI